MTRMSPIWLVACALALAGCPDSEVSVTNNMSMNNTASGNNGTSPSCNSTCLEGETSCLNERVQLSCTTGPDGCRMFGSPQSCSSGQMCQGGECVSASTNANAGPNQCTSTCQSGDGPRCNARGQVETCADRNNDGCLTYGDPVDCGEAEICQSGECVAPSCDAPPCELGATQCGEDGQLQTCQMQAGCLVFGAGKECPTGETCDAGSCVPETTCDDECPAGEQVCSPEGVPRVCEDGDGNGCVEYVDQSACASGEECRQGGCVAASTCEDACATPGERVCDGSAIQVCRDDDGDGCVEFSSDEDCALSSQICDAASVSCVAPPTSGAVVINEVFYDAQGADVNADDESVEFIELKGPPGRDVSGWELRLVNGANGQTYQSVVFDPGTVVDGDGLVTVATDKADSLFTALLFGGSTVLDILPAGSAGAIQNGADNVELYDDTGAKVDALGYGDFTGAMFTGEGSPAEEPFIGRSIGRLPGASDTDDNSADFYSLLPTPGLDNSDLVINEAYIDQPGADGQIDDMETFVELSSPIRGWIDVGLENYRLHAINGSDGSDYIFTGAEAGIDLSGFGINDLPNAEGFVTICNLGVRVSLLGDCTVPYDGPDFEDGPDALVLTYDGRVIDALGYGTFGPGTTNPGEGSPAAFDTNTDAGKSLNRWPLFDPSKNFDTGDNATDFHLAEPTLARENKRPAQP